jgi:hypothetical protein
MLIQNVYVNMREGWKSHEPAPSLDFEGGEEKSKEKGK